MPKRRRKAATLVEDDGLNGLREALARCGWETPDDAVIASIHMMGDWYGVGMQAAINGKRHPLLVEAFKYFGLDPELPIHHSWLLCILAHTAFTRGRRGRKKGSVAWAPARLFRLGLHYRDVAGHRVSDVAAATAIKKRFPEVYQYDSVNTLRLLLSDAISELEVREDRLREMMVEEERTQA
jgi:hypothetical protein